MAVLKIKDGNNWTDIQTIKGYTPVKGVDYFTPADIASLNIPKQVILTGTITAGNDSITLTDASILADSLIEVYTDTYGITPINITSSVGTVTVTFRTQYSNLGVKVVIR